MDILIIVITVLVVSSFYEWRRRRLIRELQAEIQKHQQVIKRALAKLLPPD